MHKLRNGLAAIGRVVTRGRVALALLPLTLAVAVFGFASPAAAESPNPGVTKSPGMTTPEALAHIPRAAWIAPIGIIVAIVLAVRWKRNHPS